VNSCWQGQAAHLPGVIRPDGSQYCARCQQQLEPPLPERAWGAEFQTMRSDKALKNRPGRPTTDTPARPEGRGNDEVIASNRGVRGGDDVRVLTC